jgi:hypothetical protein
MKILLRDSSLRNRNMIAKNAAVDNSLSGPSVSRRAPAKFVPAVAAARIHAAVKAQAPEGYEDGEGFHFGRPNHTNESSLLRHPMSSTSPDG